MKKVDVDRRQQVGRLIHSLWTQGGSDPSGLAPILLDGDGRIDLLGKYVMFQEDEDTQNAEGSLPASATAIDRIHCRDLSYAEFVTKYMHPKRPVIIQGLSDDWKARSKWVCQKGRDVPDLDYLSETFGSDLVPVYEQLHAGFSTMRPVRKEMDVSAYAEWWNKHHCKPNEECTDPSPLLYLKDWKFVASHPNYGAYEWPDFFRDDWLNQAMGNAYKFVYLGPRGTSTVLHADVLRSFSWSTNVCGQKRWYLVPPEKTYLLFDCFGKTLATHLHADLEDGMGVFFPGLAQVRQHAVQVEQNAGETIFVPSKWYHTVENLEPTLSINHNWLNRANIGCSWEALRTEIRALHKDDRNESDANSQQLEAETSSDSSAEQLGDDLILLWHVLSMKAQSILNDISTGIDCREQRQDLQAALDVLTDLQSLVREGHGLGLDKRSDYNLDDLIVSIKSIP